MEQRLITVAIHTYERALELKAVLEHEGIEVSLQNVNLTTPVVASGVRVRIRENDLPLALRIIENAEIFASQAIQTPPDSKKSIVLVPVDFTPHSDKAVTVAFNFAASHRASIVLLHTFVDPSVTGTLQLSDTLDYDITSSEMRQQLKADAESRMRAMAETLRCRIKHGELPPVKFTHTISEGVPEDAICDYAKTNRPILIIMGTRGAETKERELVGSVTAEVLDTCRTPVFTVPDNFQVTTIHSLNHVAFFCSLDQEDILALDELWRLAGGEPAEVTFIHVPRKKQRLSTDGPMKALLSYCAEHYPAYTFSESRLSHADAPAEFASILRTKGINIIAVPNRKKNVFARLFNPGIAHRLLFHTDIPMIVLPV